MKSYVKEDCLFFLMDGLEKTALLKSDLLRQVASAYGKVFKVGGLLCLKPADEFRGREKKLLAHIIGEFEFIWEEFEKLHPEEDVRQA